MISSNAEQLTKKNQKTYLETTIEMLPILIPYFLGFFIFHGLRSAFPLYLQFKFHFTEAQLVQIWGLISGTSLLVGGLTRVPAGITADRVGRRRTIYLGMLLYGSSILTLLFLTNIIGWIIGFAVIRISTNLIAMAGRSSVTDVNDQRAFRNGLLSSMVGVGGFLGPFFLNGLIMFFPPDYMVISLLLLIAIDFLIFNLISFIMERNYPNHETKRLLGKKESKFNWETAKIVFSRALVPSIVMFTIAGIIGGINVAVQSVYGYYRVHLTAIEIGTIAGIAVGINIIFSPISGIIAQKTNEKATILVGQAFFALCGLTLSLFGQNVIFFLIGYIFWGLAISFYYVADITRIGNVVPKEAFSVQFGLLTSLVILFQSVGSYLGSFLYTINAALPYTAIFLLGLTGVITALTVPLPKNHVIEL